MPGEISSGASSEIRKTTQSAPQREVRTPAKPQVRETRPAQTAPRSSEVKAPAKPQVRETRPVQTAPRSSEIKTPAKPQVRETRPEQTASRSTEVKTPAKPKTSEIKKPTQATGKTTEVRTPAKPKTNEIKTSTSKSAKKEVTPKAPIREKQETKPSWVAGKKDITSNSSVRETKDLKETTYKRPGNYRAGVRDAVWEKAKDDHGRVRDPGSGKYMSKDKPWDMGHKPGYEFSKHQKSAEERNISRKQFLDEHNNPDHYRPELPSSNRSHKGESKTLNYYNNKK